MDLFITIRRWKTDDRSYIQEDITTRRQKMEDILNKIDLFIRSRRKERRQKLYPRTTLGKPQILLVQNSDRTLSYDCVTS
jgi:hypothetical protein